MPVDGPSTRWGSAFTNNEWIYVDLGSTTTISRVVLNWEAAYGSGYQIQVSDNATTWTTIFTTTTGNGAIDDLTVSGSGRYVRIGTARATQWGYSPRVPGLRHSRRAPPCSRRGGRSWHRRRKGLAAANAVIGAAGTRWAAPSPTTSGSTSTWAQRHHQPRRC